MTERMMPIKSQDIADDEIRFDASKHGNQAAEDSGLVPHQWQAYLIGDAQCYIKEITSIWFGLATQLFYTKEITGLI